MHWHRILFVHSPNQKKERHPKRIFWLSIEWIYQCIFGELLNGLILILADMCLAHLQYFRHFTDFWWWLMVFNVFAISTGASFGIIAYRRRRMRKTLKIHSTIYHNYSSLVGRRFYRFNTKSMNTLHSHNSTVPALRWMIQKIKYQINFYGIFGFYNYETG